MHQNIYIMTETIFLFHFPLAGWNPLPRIAERARGILLGAVSNA